MLFLVYSLDNPTTGKEIRRRTRATHLRYVAENKDRFQYGGALLGDDGKMIGTLTIIRAVDRSALDQFLANDPYNKANLFTKVIVNQTTKSLPESVPGDLAAEVLKAEANAG